MLNLALNAALIPPFKAFGAAWASVAAKLAVTCIGLRNFRRVTDYPLVIDFAEYLGISASAFCAAVAATEVLPYPTGSGMVAFAVIYLALVALVRWRRYGRRPGVSPS